MKSETLTKEKNQLKTMKDIYHFIKDENVRPLDSVLTIIGKKFHDENAISDYLAYVLDPWVNGVGYQPLENFLKLLDIKIDLSVEDVIDIQREYIFNNNRRIDFLITINEEYLIAIEHKVFSEEHGDQTWNYEKEINKSSLREIEHKTYVFLTPNGKQALNPVFVPISYDKLVSALKNVNVNFIKDIRKAVLYNEMIFHLEGYFMNDKKIALSNKSLLFIENEKMIEDLRKQFERDYEYIFQYIESVIKNYYTNNLEGNWNFNFKKTRGYHQIFKTHWKENGLDIHFELNLSEKSLVHQEVSFLLDIEGNRKKEFTAQHETRLKEQLTQVMDENGILYRRGKRADTFAIKTYHFLTPDTLTDETTFKNHLLEMIEDFTEFIDVIDQEIDYFLNEEM